MRREVMPIEGLLARADVPGICERAHRGLERSDADVLICDLSGVVADAVVLETLARLELANVPVELDQLLAFTGLAGVLLAVEAGRQAEEREQALGLEEGVQADDPAA